MVAAMAIPIAAAVGLLGRAGVGFVSLTENFDFTTASGRKAA